MKALIDMINTNSDKNFLFQVEIKAFDLQLHHM